ncbi:hypothetical protein K474DRAFT_1618178 [Panus rudis PR-1116 ss-1]|nr:hypothetical protein K474DRAFT_1618178 [Panus rudis PR-1116 ss-1]
MPRTPKFTPGPSRLSRILQNLTRQPKPIITNLKALKLTLAAKNDHWGARHFVKEELPRIRYANPGAEIEVNKVPKSPSDGWKPEMVVEFRDGKSTTLSLEQKHSATIFTELMDLFNTPTWQRWRKQRTEAFLPLVEPPVHVPSKLEIKAEALGDKAKKAGGKVAEFVKAREQGLKRANSKKAGGEKKGKGKKGDEGAVDYEEMLFGDPNRPKTGAAAVLP